MEELSLDVRADGVTHMKYFLSSSTIATGLVVAAELDTYRDNIMTFLNGKPVEPVDAQPTEVIRWQSPTPRVKPILEHPALQQWLVKQDDDDVIRTGLCKLIPFHLFIPMKTLQITGIELNEVHACSDFEEGLRELIEPLTQSLFINKSGWMKQLTLFLEGKDTTKTPSELPLVYEIEDVPEIICDVLESFGLIDVKDYSMFALRPRLLACLLDGSLLNFIQGHKPIVI